MRPRRITAWLFFTTLSILIVLLLAGGFLVNRARTTSRRTQAEIQRRIGTIRAAGQPLNANDLARLFPDPPPEHDARRVLEPAVALLSVPEDPPDVPFFGEAPLPHSGALNEATKTEIQKLIERSRPALDALPWDHLEGAWVGCGLTNGFDHLTLMPLKPITQLIKILCLEAVLQAEARDSEGASLALQRALAVGATFRNDIPVHHLVRCLSQVEVCQTLERVMNRTSVSPSNLVSLSSALTVTNLAAVQESIIYERCHGLFRAGEIETLANPVSSGGGGPPRTLLGLWKSRLLYQDEDLLQYLDWNQQCLAALDLPFWGAISRLQRIEETNGAKRRTSLIDGFSRRGPSLLMGIFEPRISGFLSREAGSVAQVRVTATAVAIERWRFEHGGALPKALQDLVPTLLPAVPIDPFSEEPLSYSRLAGGYVVSTVGKESPGAGASTSGSNGNQSNRQTIAFTMERDQPTSR